VALSHPNRTSGPRSSWKRFCAELPNHCWQADVTHWHLAHGGGVEILNILDDHSRLAIASLARRSIGGPDVVDTFTTAFTRWGTPASVLTDNGAIFTGAPRRGGRTALEITLGELGIRYLNSRPYHPQTCGKIERFHQTQKKWLTAHPAATLAQLQTLLDEFTDYYNRVRPHRAIGTATPIQAFNARPKGHRDRLPHPRPLPGTYRCHRRRRRHHHPLQQPPAPHRIKQATARHQSHCPHRRPRHPRPRPPHRPTHPQTGPRPHPRLPTTRRQMRKLTRKQAVGVNHVSGHLSTMSRDTTVCPRQDSNLRPQGLVDLSVFLA
jgi:hypothetical protein